MPDAPITTAPRTLRCANAALYAGFVLIVWAAAAYVCIFRAFDLWMLLVAVAACLLTLAWGGYYMLLRYEVDAAGVTKRLFGVRCRIDWADLTDARLCETRAQETASAVLHLQTPTASLTLSSDLLSLDAVQELAREIGARAAVIEN